MWNYRVTSKATTSIIKLALGKMSFSVFLHIQYENMACNSFSTVVCGRTNSCVTPVITIGVSYLCKVYH